MPFPSKHFISLILPAFLALPLLAQSAAAPAAKDPESPVQRAVPLKVRFDVVSIRPSGNTGAPMSHSTAPDGDSMSFRNIPIVLVILYAYDFNRPDLVSGLPNWTNDKYDIVVKVSQGDVENYHKLSQLERKEMLQSALAERLMLQVHREPRPMPVYKLVLAKNHDKLNEVEAHPYPNGQTVRYQAGELTAHGATMQEFANALSNTGVTGRQVVDDSGLPGRYDFTIKFAVDQVATPPKSPGDSSQGQLDPTAPSIFSAIQEQLGLKLEPSTDQVDSLVIDHIEKPTPN